MATYIETLTKSNGDVIAPRTVTEAILTKDGEVLEEKLSNLIPDMSIMDEKMFEKFGRGEEDSEYFFSQANWDHLQIYNRAYVQCYDNENDLRLGEDGKGQYALRAITRFGNGTIPKYPWMKKSDWPSIYRKNHSQEYDCFLYNHVIINWGLENTYFVKEVETLWDVDDTFDAHGNNTLYVYAVKSTGDIVYWNSDLEGNPQLAGTIYPNEGHDGVSATLKVYITDEEIMATPPADSDYSNMATIAERMPTGHIRVPKGFSSYKGDPSQLVTSKHYVDTAVATRAPKLEHPGDGQTHVYSINGNNKVQPIKVGANTATEDTIVKRTSSGTVRTNNPTDNLDAANKRYVDSAVNTIQSDLDKANSSINTLTTKLDTKLTRKTIAETDSNRYVYTQSYKKSSDGIELMQIGQNTSPANSIVRRTSGGTIKTNTPSADNDAANKKYVDSAIDEVEKSAVKAEILYEHVVSYNAYHYYDASFDTNLTLTFICPFADPITKGDSLKNAMQYVTKVEGWCSSISHHEAIRLESFTDNYFNIFAEAVEEGYEDTEYYYPYDSEWGDPDNGQGDIEILEVAVQSQSITPLVASLTSDGTTIYPKTKSNVVEMNDGKSLEDYLAEQEAQINAALDIILTIQDELINGALEYELNTSGTSYTVKGIGTYKSSDIVIPDTHRGIVVSKIAENAFQGNLKLTSAVIGKNILTVGKCAFEGCSNLTSIQLTRERKVYDPGNGWTVEECYGQTDTAIYSRLASDSDPATVANLWTITQNEGDPWGDYVILSTDAWHWVALPW